MKERSVFDDHIDRYEAWFEKHALAYQSELAAIRTLLPQSGSGLEIGVGSGLFAAFLGIKHGVDPSLTMLKKARTRGIEAVQGVAEMLPYPDSKFDFALMVTTVCFLDDIERAFEEACRVLKPGGCLLIGFVDKNSPIGRSYEQRKNESLFYKEATFYAVDDLLGHLKHAGFKQFSFCQTLIDPEERPQEMPVVRTGYGEGSFVVIKAAKETEEQPA